MRTEHMKVGRIERENDRILLYERPVAPNWEPLYGEYHVIAKADCQVNVGDTIEYEQGGINFGWMIARKEVSHDHPTPR